MMLEQIERNVINLDRVATEMERHLKKYINSSLINILWKMMEMLSYHPSLTFLQL